MTQKTFPRNNPRCDLKTIGNVDLDGTAMQQAEGMLRRRFGDDVFAHIRASKAAAEVVELAAMLEPVELSDPDAAMRGLLSLPKQSRAKKLEAE